MCLLRIVRKFLKPTKQNHENLLLIAEYIIHNIVNFINFCKFTKAYTSNVELFLGIVRVIGFYIESVEVLLKRDKSGSTEWVVIKEMSEVHIGVTRSSLLSNVAVQLHW